MDVDLDTSGNECCLYFALDPAVFARSDFVEFGAFVLRECKSGSRSAAACPRRLVD